MGTLSESLGHYYLEKQLVFYQQTVESRKITAGNHATGRSFLPLILVCRVEEIMICKDILTAPEEEEREEREAKT